jgi:hypothetical protein
VLHASSDTLTHAAIATYTTAQHLVHLTSLAAMLFSCPTHSACPATAARPLPLTTVCLCFYYPAGEQLTERGEEVAGLVQGYRDQGAALVAGEQVFLHMEMGWALAQRGVYSEALRSYKLALEMDPDHAIGWFRWAGSEMMCTMIVLVWWRGVHVLVAGLVLCSMLHLSSTAWTGAQAAAAAAAAAAVAI